MRAKALSKFANLFLFFKRTLFFTYVFDAAFFGALLPTVFFAFCECSSKEKRDLLELLFDFYMCSLSAIVSFFLEAHYFSLF